MQFVLDFVLPGCVFCTAISGLIFFGNAVRLPFHIKPEAKSIPFIQNPFIAMSNRHAITERGQRILKVCELSSAGLVVGFVVTLGLCLFFWWIGLLPHQK